MAHVAETRLPKPLDEATASGAGLMLEQAHTYARCPALNCVHCSRNSRLSADHLCAFLGPQVSELSEYRVLTLRPAH